ncbi:choice-of-anchor V domain-containing protein [Taibaiella soli]|uniref:Secretion system C-terminal sorting domain-containing protein n=1 Tax=Taibaiella soli TaxID=1649169 RepID=A0A2W2AE68_9BACT|nr:choice-of-anchor V domain-containing protein [Taibaiella soli]PZF73581.1 hypothetical protein DN068_07615 [Taibaiella soli]
MKKKTLTIILLAGFSWVCLESFSTGAGAGAGMNATDSPSGCSCHGVPGIATPGINMSIQVMNGNSAVSSYIPGNSYTIRLTGTNTTGGSLPRFGYQLTATKTTGTANAGSLSAPSGSHAISIQGINIIEQSSALMPFSGTGGNGTQYVVNIPWTAPATGTGNVSLASVINAVNNNGAFDPDDKWNTTSVTIAEDGVQTAVSELKNENNISVYPNPANSSFILNLPQSAGPAEVYIINSIGQLMRTYSVHKNSTTFTPDLPAGLYHISVISNDRKYVSQLLIQ